MLSSKYSYTSFQPSQKATGSFKLDTDIENHTPGKAIQSFPESKMPLVVPGLMGNSDEADKDEEWRNKLVGKKITDDRSDETCFSKKDLPPGYRIAKHDELARAEHIPDR
ncbi:MAG: hypothetical protein Q9163_004353 [Psora crenata]